MGVQHGRRASEEEKRDGEIMVEKVNENEELNDKGTHETLLAYAIISV